MKCKKLLGTRLVSILLATSVSCTVYAQTENEDNDDIFELSPFVVESQQDEGYMASATLAGSRIRTDIKDLGVSLAVLTEEFMEDTGTTDGESILAMVGNVEVGGVLGNFSNISGENSTQSSRLNPQGSQRIRGLASAVTTRDYFTTQLPFDSYNTSRLEINRGPNSILFGLGSPGGVINNSTSRAMHNTDTTRISFRIDHHGGHRETLNFNRALIEDRLAVRIAVMNEEQKFNQKPAFEDDTRYYLAADWVIAKNEKSGFLGRTSARGSYEEVRIWRNPPDVVPPTDGFSSFFHGVGSEEDLFKLLRTPGVDLTDISNQGVTEAQVRAAVAAGLATVPEGMTLDEYAAVEGSFIPKTLVNRFAPGSDPTRGGRNNIAGGASFWIFPAINYNSVDAAAPGWDAAELAGIQGIMGRWRPNGFPTQDTIWSNPVTGGSGFEAKSIMNRDVFDYHKLLFQGTTNYIDTDYELKQFYFTQEFFDGVHGLDAGIELAYDRQSRERERFTPFSSGTPKRIRIDLTTHHAMGDANAVPGVRDGIPDSFPNENVGRPLAFWNDNNTRWERHDYRTQRGTAFTRLDFSEMTENRWGKWLGQHTLTGLFEKNTVDTWNLSIRPAWWADNSKWPGSRDISNGLNNNFRRIVKSQIYLGDSVVNLNSADEVRIDGYLDMQFPRVGDEYGIWYFDNNNAIDQGQIATWRLIEAINSADLAKRVLESKAFSYQASILDGHISAMYARRKDEQEAYQRIQHNTTYGVPGEDPAVIPQRVDLPGENEVDGNFNLELLELLPDPASVDKGTTETWSVVGKLPEIGYELPFGADLRFHYYEAESFQPAGVSVNILNQPLASPAGETKEYGGTLTLFDDRLSIRLNIFETVSANARTNLGGQLNQVVERFNFFLTRIVDAENDTAVPLYPNETDILLTPETTPSNRQRLSGTDADLAGFQTWDDYYAAIIAAIPPEVQSVYNFQVATTESGERFVERNTIPGRNSTQDYVAEGFELDITGRLTKNLSISFNLAKQETTLSNIGPVAIPLAFETLGNLETPIPGSPGNYPLTVLRDSPYQVEQGTIGTRYNVVIREMLLQQGQEGQVSQEQRKWRWNLTLRHDWFDGRLKGFSLGGTLRYQDEIAAGYPNTEVVTESGDSLILPDVQNPYLGPDSLNGDLFLRYRKKFKNFDWTIQLNARNLYRSDGSDDVPVYINPDGSVAVVRIPVEQQFFLTNTFSF
ncbi:MAG: TonB-dependent receptor plug domain-containing protein [Puniceicoccaceae bacterium]